ncbi:type II toxin-antitoxin system prevent-host-death family antitoxin [Vannielia sp. SX4]|uniref:type II toxin-antitoxin system prevent-host-death family antitoxin n=1 Tax=Vannielia sp. SX4 TaxID=3463852 RepID=UPI00405A497F
MREYSATDLANKTGDVLAAAAREEVEITRHGKPRYVIMSHERFERLIARGDTRQAFRNEDLSEEAAAEIIAALEESLKDE